ncbi:lysozyme inhibitor LprI family protein [Leptotrichia trevisanii]|uniref:lysozyme inhibitor LprI family protein n=1 Tax=Leptotrichia trevisanii TaxID=109328 RepID=UPI0026EF08CF|nr:lysozyme inhibitor LprI family protein [Leptotrichia trevisanii]
MQEKNNQNIIKILIAIIISLSMIILFSGVFYILNMQNKLAKLETEQKEQTKRQLETQNMASVQTVQFKPNTKTTTEVKAEPKAVKTNANIQKSSYEKAMIKRMKPIENELNYYTYENTRYCGEFLGYREKLHQKWDDELTKIYKLLMSKYSDSQKKNLKGEEIAWIKKRQKAIDKIASEMNGCLGGVVIENTEIDTIKKRAIELARRYDGL